MDMGADEYSGALCGASEADFNDDEIVNLLDFCYVACAWLTDSEDPDWNEDCDLNEDDDIDSDDLELFAGDWIMETCPQMEARYASEGGGGMFMMMGMGTMMVMEDIGIEASPIGPVTSENTIDQEIIAIADALGWFKTVWLEDEEVRTEIDAEAWLEFVDSVEDYLDIQKLKKIHDDISEHEPPTIEEQEAAEKAKKHRQDSLDSE